MLAEFTVEKVKGGVILTVEGRTKFVANKSDVFFQHGAHMYEQGVDFHDCFPGLSHDERKFLKVGPWSSEEALI